METTMDQTMGKLISINSLYSFKTGVKEGQTFTRIWYYEHTQQADYPRIITRVLAKGFYIDDLETGKKLWVDFKTTNDWYFEDGYIYMIYNHLAAYDKAMKTLKKQSEIDSFLERYNDFKKALYAQEFRTISKPIGIKENRRTDFFKVLAIYKLSE